MLWRSQAAGGSISAVHLKTRMVFWKPGFRERLLALLPKRDANVQLGQGQHNEGAALMRGRRAEGGNDLQSRTTHAGLTEEELDERPRSDPLKWKMAKAIRTETTVPLNWIARRLDLGSDSNVCYKINRSRFKS
jgi:hypothetical protein